MPWAYLFERFPSFTQTFCYREVSQVEREGLAPWIFSIRRPAGEPTQDFPPGMAARVRYLPAAADLADEFRWLKRSNRVPDRLASAVKLAGGERDAGRLKEAAWLGAQLATLGVTHVHAHFAGIAARTARRLREHHGVEYSFTAHANDIFSPPDPEIALTLGELVEGARFVVTVSDFSAEILRRRFPAAAGKIHRVYNGIDCRAFTRAKPAANPPSILAVGRYIEKKGFADLVAACALLRDRGVTFRCGIVGEGPLRAELEGAIGRAGLNGRVELLGPRSNREVDALLTAARVFALPCVEEADGGMDNLPTVIAEAMAAGLPVVSTRLAGVPEMVIDGRTGRLAPPGRPDQFADALASYLSNPAAADADGARGRKRAERLFSLEVTGRELTRVLLKEAATAPPRGLWRRDPALAWQLRRAGKSPDE